MIRVGICGKREIELKKVRRKIEWIKETLITLEVDYFKSEKELAGPGPKKPYDLVIMMMEEQGGSISLETLSGLIDVIAGRWMRVQKALVWKHDYKTVVLRTEEIFFFRSDRRKIKVYLQNESYRINTTMAQEEKRLGGEGFVRIHRNCLVNLRHIGQHKGNTLILKNGKRLTISSRRRPYVKEILKKLGQT